MPSPASPASPARAVGYIRVSTDEQSNGPKAQIDALHAWAAREGRDLVAVFEDLGVSGAAALDRRPGLLAALDLLAELGKGASLVVAKRDRLARDVILAAMVERLAARTGGRVVTADGTANGDGPEAQLMRGIVDLFAQYEREIIRARTRAALAAKRARGEVAGTAPLGHRAEDGRLVADDAEGEALSLVVSLRAEGLSIRAVADELNRRGVPARGKRWHKTTVARVLAREAA